MCCAPCGVCALSRAQGLIKAADCSLPSHLWETSGSHPGLTGWGASSFLLSAGTPRPPSPRRPQGPRASFHVEPDPLPLNGTLCKRPLFNPAPLSGLQMPAIIWYPSPPVHLFARLLICCLESLGGAGPPSRHRPRRVLPPFLVGIPGRTQVQNQPPP